MLKVQVDSGIIDLIKHDSKSGGRCDGIQQFIKKLCKILI